MPKQKSQLSLNPTEKDQLRYNAVLLEDIRSQMSAVIEATESTKTTLEEKIDGVEKRLTERIEVVEVVVKQNSEDIRKNSEGIQSLQVDVKEIKQKLDAVAEKVERHDEDIVFLKSAVTQN